MAEVSAEALFAVLGGPGDDRVSITAEALFVVVDTASEVDPPPLPPPPSLYLSPFVNRRKVSNG